MRTILSQPLCFSELGNKPNQEDALYPLMGKATRDSRVLLVCDGMGGHEHGEVASACVAGIVGRMTEDAPFATVEEMKATFEHALAKAYDQLDALDTDTTGKKMGTTLTFFAPCTDGYLVAHIGDSRVYLLRRGEGAVFKTRDHSLVNDLIAAGEITEEEARSYPQRNIITRAIQPHQEFRAKPAYNVLRDLHKGDLLMLCSDGIVEQLTDDDLCRLLLTNQPLEERIEALRKACADRQTRDNHTCYLLEVEEATLTTRPLSHTPASATETGHKDPGTSEDRSHHPLLILAITLVALCLVLACFLFARTADSASDDKSNAEQTQGLIIRHQK